MRSIKLTALTPKGKELMQKFTEQDRALIVNKTSEQPLTILLTPKTRTLIQAMQRMPWLAIGSIIYTLGIENINTQVKVEMIE
jgi:V8-like Glu-specific endopeptidase